MTKEEELGIGKSGRKVDMKDEYYVSLLSRTFMHCLTLLISRQRLAAKDLDDWEQKRVERLPGEPDGTA